jgi:MFS transporter, DHA1 family, multidrug resistance protein
MLYFIYFVIVIAFLDTFSQLPIIAPFAQSLGASNFLIGLIIGMYSLSNMGGNIIAGQWIDMFGRKKILMIGLFFVSFCLLGYTFVTTSEQLLFIRFIHGIGGGLLVPAAFAFLSDHTQSSSRGKTMAFSGACIGISAIIGPAFGAITNQVAGINWVFYIISSLFVFTAILVGTILNENYIPTEKTKNTFDPQKFRKLLQLPPLVNAYLGAFSLMLTLGVLAYKLPLKIEALGISTAYSGKLLSTFGIVAIVFFLLPTNQIFDQIRREKVIIYGMYFVTFALVMLSFFNQILFLFASMIFYGVGFAFIFPSITALVVDHTDEEERGRAFGLFYAFFSLGVVVGSVLIGALNVQPNGGFFAGACIILLLAFVIRWRIK